MEGSKSKFKDSLDALNAQIIEIEELLNDKYGACEAQIEVANYALWWAQGKDGSDPWIIRVECNNLHDEEEVWDLVNAPPQYRVEAAAFIPELVKELEKEIDRRILGIESVTDLLKQLCVGVENE